MNYSELVVAVTTYCENTFPTTQMNTFIQQAEQRIYSSVQLPNLRKTATTSLTASTPYFNAPNDFLSVYSFAVVNADGSYTFLLNKDVDFIREAYPTPATAATPKYYAIYGPQTTATELKFILGPTPSAALATDLQYFFYPESIVTASTTWLGDNFDSALFNGTMLEAITYMKGEPDMVKLYNDRYVQSITLLKNLGDGKERQDAYRSGQVRVAVS
jgi:hypothetical protein